MDKLPLGAVRKETEMFFPSTFLDPCYWIRWRACCYSRCSGNLVLLASKVCNCQIPSFSGCLIHLSFRATSQDLGEISTLLPQNNDTLCKFLFSFFLKEKAQKILSFFTFVFFLFSSFFRFFFILFFYLISFFLCFF